MPILHISGRCKTGYHIINKDTAPTIRHEITYLCIQHILITVMKKLISLLFLLIFSGITVSAKHIDEQTAKSVGQRFLVSETKTSAPIQAGDLQLVYTSASRAINPAARVAPDVFFYVFNVSTQGFVIISGDDNVIPVLGYSDQGSFDPDNIPDNARKWLEAYKDQIRYAIENDLPAGHEVKQAWARYQDGNTPDRPGKTTAVAPLIQTKWNQNPHENALCPGGSVTGCVATAMAQIMKFWSYPMTGTGFHSYNHPYYGTLSANFGATTYQWSSMPNTVNGSNKNEVAKLMYHCGVSVEMDYSPSSSGAFVISARSPIQNCAEYAFRTYFKYKSTLQGVVRDNYTQTQWINLLKAELDAGRPVLYAGFGNGGGHAFVCDGYDNSNYFHFNWGWGGAYDGYFTVNALNPSGVGTGGGSGGFNDGQQAIIGLEPPAGGGGGGQTSGITLSAPISTNPIGTLFYGQPVEVTMNVINNGSTTFQGDYCAAVFDGATLIDSIEVKYGYTLQPGNTHPGGGITFQATRMNSMVPGITYNIAILYRPTGGNWTQVASGSYQNPVQLDVEYASEIEVTAPLTVTPGTILTEGQPASVNLNFANEGLTTFYGQLAVGICNYDGSMIQIINSYNETNGLSPGFEYTYPYLTLSTTAVSVPPGSYLLAAVYQYSGSSAWWLAGSTFTQNPIRITVQAPPINPDIYETNNTVAQAYNLPVTFSGNTTTKNTAGSNFHIGTDNDFYKINLPAGYTYVIKPRLHDSYNSGNGQTYTVDALFSYSQDGITWSDTYDDVMTGDIVVSGGGTVYFHVAPYFTGSTGTYRLDMGITRSGTTDISKTFEAANIITIYPNPSKDIVYVDPGIYENRISEITLVNMQGQRIQTVYPAGQAGIISLPLNDLAGGIYFIQLQTGNGMITKKITVGK